MVKYGLWLKTSNGENPVEMAHKAVVAWFTKIEEIDKHTIIHLWAEMDWKNKEKLLTNQRTFLSCYQI